MNPPMIAPKVGPEKVREIVHAIATPRYCGLQQSTITPPKIATGETPNKPEKNRPRKMVAALCAKAGMRENIEARANPISIGYFRPNRSDSGAIERKPNT